MRAQDDRTELRYTPNPKHKEPWQPGRRGSLCPSDIGRECASRLLQDSLQHGRHRYAVKDGRAFAGQQDGTGAWHGYPVGWVEVPAPIRQRFHEMGVVDRRAIHRYWKRTLS